MDLKANATYLNCGVAALFNSISPDWLKMCEQITSLTFPHHSDGTGLAAYRLLISHRSLRKQRAVEGVWSVGRGGACCADSFLKPAGVLQELIRKNSKSASD